VLTYDADTGQLTEVCSKGIRHIRFMHNAEGLISAAWLPDETVVGYTYQEKRLSEVRQFASSISEQDFTSGKLPQETEDDIVSAYGYSETAPGSGHYAMTSIFGVANTDTQMAPVAKITYSRATGALDTLMQATRATDAHGNVTDIAYDSDTVKPTTLSSYTPAELSDPVRATKSVYNASGLVTDTWTGTPDDVAGGSARHSQYSYLEYLPTATTTECEYQSLDGGVVSRHQAEKSSTTEYGNSLDLPTTTIDENGSLSETDYGAPGTINEEEATGQKTFDADGALTSDVQYIFDEAGRQITEADLIQETTSTREYYPNGDLKRSVFYRQKFSAGKAQGPAVAQSETTYEYDRYGNVIKETTTSYGSPAVTTQTTSSYDGLGRVLEATSGTLVAGALCNWTKTVNAYDFRGQITSTTSQEEGSAPKTTATVYNRDGSVARQIDEVGTTTNFTYDEIGRTLSTTVVPAGKPAQTSTTDYGYRTITLNAPEGTKDLKAAVATSTDPAGIVTRTYADGLDREVRTTAAGVNTDVTYTADDKVFATIVLPESRPRAEAKVSVSLYDLNGNASASVQQPVYEDGHYAIDDQTILTQSSYDSAGKEKTRVDALGRATSYTYDKKGNTSSVTQPETSVVVDAADFSEQSTGQESISPVTSFETDVIDPVAGTTSDTVRDALRRLSKIQKDASGNVLAITDFGQSTEAAGAGITTRYTYNDKGQKERETFANGDFKTISYDSRGNLVETKWFRANGALELSSACTYDSFSRLLSATDYQHQGQVQAPIYHQQNVYDKSGQLTASYEATALPVSPGNIEETDMTRYLYDRTGRITERLYPKDSTDTTSTPVALKYIYDSEGRISDVTAVLKTGNTAREATLCHYRYDPWNRASEVDDYLNFAQGSATYLKKHTSYDLFDRVTEISYALSTDPSTTLESFTYAYNKNSQITSEHHVASYPGRDPIDQERDCSYDELGRLISSDLTDSAADTTSTRTYGYDRIGNRRMEATDGQARYSLFNGLNQVTAKETEDSVATLTYDANGNLSLETTGGAATTYSYDTENHLTSVKVGDNVINSNTYRSDGQRISKTEGEETTTYIYQAGSVLFTTDGTGQKSSFNLYGPEGDVLATKRYRGDQADTYLTYTTDTRNSVSSVLGSDGNALLSYTYGDFGETTRTGDASVYNEMAYINGIYDESTQQYYLNARYYDPVDGRFLTRDPARDSAEKGLYAYCAGDPVNGTDPSGLNSIRCIYYNRPGHGFYTQSHNSPYFSNSKTDFTGVISKKDFIDAWNNKTGARYTKIYLYLHGGSGKLYFANEDMSRSEVVSKLNYKSWHPLVYLFSCYGAAGGKSGSIAGALAGRVGGSAEGCTGGVSFVKVLGYYYPHVAAKDVWYATWIWYSA